MKIKVFRKGFGRKNLKVFRLNKKSICFNIFGIAVFVYKEELVHGK